MTSAPERHQLFISYSRADREWVDRLKTMLAPLVRGDDFRLWDDSQIPPGARWQEEIARALTTARVAVLLVSADFLHSDYVNNKELPPLLRAAQEEGLVLLWVCVRHCLVEDTPIHDFQAAIDPGRPLAALAPWEQDEALAKVAKAIKGAFQRAREREARRNAERAAAEEEARENAERAAAEEEARENAERAAAEEEARENAKRAAAEKEAREKEAREKQAREEQAREQAAREIEARAAAARERERQKEANAREARQKEAKEREVRKKEARQREAEVKAEADRLTISVASGQASALSRQRLPEGETAELLAERSGLLGQRAWRVRRLPLQVWGGWRSFRRGWSFSWWRLRRAPL